jgi:hypothetical protein
MQRLTSEFAGDQTRTEKKSKLGRANQIMQPDSALYAPILFLLPLPILIGIASAINAAVGRKMINGALVYLVLVAAVFAFAVWRAIFNPANTPYDAGHLVGTYIFWFGIPMVVAIYFAARFRGK